MPVHHSVVRIYLVASSLRFTCRWANGLRQLSVHGYRSRLSEKLPELQDTRYKLMHADLVNVASYFNKAQILMLGHCSLYGLGLIHNEDNGNCPFCILLWRMGRYRLFSQIASHNGGELLLHLRTLMAVVLPVNLRTPVSLTAGLSVTLTRVDGKKWWMQTPFSRMIGCWIFKTWQTKTDLLMLRHKSRIKSFCRDAQDSEIEGLLKNI